MSHTNYHITLNSMPGRSYADGKQVECRDDLQKRRYVTPRRRSLSTYCMLNPAFILLIIFLNRTVFSFMGIRLHQARYVHHPKRSSRRYDIGSATSNALEKCCQIRYTQTRCFVNVTDDSSKKLYASCTPKHAYVATLPLPEGDGRLLDLRRGCRCGFSVGQLPK